MSEGKLRVLCFGVGAIGTYIGGSLALAGQDVTFVDRPEVAQDVTRRGLQLNLKGQEHRVETPSILTTPAEALAAGQYDIAILAVKSFDTRTMVDEVLHLRNQLPPILCLQNGVDNEKVLSAALGKDKVIAGTVTTAIERRGAGDVILRRLRGIGVANDHHASPRLVDTLNKAGLNARLYSNADSMKWSKMLTNLLANASSAILNMTPSQIFAHPGLYWLEIRQLREAMQVMAALHLPVVDLPGTPVWWLGWIARNLPPTLSQPLLAQTLGKGRGAKMPSFHIDLYAGRGKSEVDYLNGAVVRAGQQKGVKTPVNLLYNRILQALTTGEIAKSEFALQPDKLIKLVE